MLLLPFQAPRSYTSEDVVELQCHGGPVCASRILDLCLANGARRARNGEFTLRAFLNGRMDLTQVQTLAPECSAIQEPRVEDITAMVSHRDRPGMCAWPVGPGGPGMGSLHCKHS